ncbi:hypothetical protein WISP_50329 [Willisornis vidua]|uniref:Uncharacterized protein n=1 Tax=Willisornis vidua TaxID=1566151 RepID=A0ABQ9DDV4_9PASS|nr:hypothetical protein WISP_50329 [Willisornis vidua]
MIFKVRLPQCRAEWDNPLPSPAGDAVPDASRTRLALLAARALLTACQDPQDLPAFEGDSSSSQFCVICKFTQSCVQVLYADAEENRTQDGALWNPTCDREKLKDSFALCTWASTLHIYELQENTTYFTVNNSLQLLLVSMGKLIDCVKKLVHEYDYFAIHFQSRL